MVLYMRFSGSLSTCFFSLSAGHMPSLVGHPERMPRPFQTHSPTTKNDVRHLWYSRLWMVWFQGMISDQRPKSIMVATGSPSVAQVWSLWLALRRFTWERRGFPPFLLEVFNNYTIRYMYISIIIISKQGCKRNSPIHCAMVRFLTVIQRECFALLTYYSTRHFLATPLHSSRSTTVHPLSATFCGNTLNILWILSPPLTQPLTPSERMMIDASGRFAIWKSTARMPKHWKNPIKSVRPNSFMHEWQRAKQARNLNMKLDSVHPTN